MYYFMNIKVHCEWGDWNIGDCSHSCGGGVRTRTRTPKVSAMRGGEECKGPSRMDENCNLQNCQGKQFNQIRITRQNVVNN